MGVSSKRLRSLMAHPPQPPDVPGHAGTVAAFTTDADGRVQSWSREAAELFGYNADDIADHSWLILVAAGVTPSLPPPITRFLHMPLSGVFDGKIGPNSPPTMQPSS